MCDLVYNCGQFRVYNCDHLITVNKVKFSFLCYNGVGMLL